jgi:hypothetical protein
VAGGVISLVNSIVFLRALHIRMHIENIDTRVRIYMVNIFTLMGITASLATIHMPLVILGKVKGIARLIVERPCTQSLCCLISLFQ